MTNTLTARHAARIAYASRLPHVPPADLTEVVLSATEEQWPHTLAEVDARTGESTTDITDALAAAEEHALLMSDPRSQDSVDYLLGLAVRAIRANSREDQLRTGPDFEPLGSSGLHAHPDGWTWQRFHTLAQADIEPPPGPDGDPAHWRLGLRASALDADQIAAWTRAILSAEAIDHALHDSRSGRPDVAGYLRDRCTAYILYAEADARLEFLDRPNPPSLLAGEGRAAARAQLLRLAPEWVADRLGPRLDAGEYA